jgi:hypothetical protein
MAVRECHAMCFGIYLTENSGKPPTSISTLIHYQISQRHFQSIISVTTSIISVLKGRIVHIPSCFYLSNCSRFFHSLLLFALHHILFIIFTIPFLFMLLAFCILPLYLPHPHAHPLISPADPYVPVSSLVMRFN